MGPRFGYFLSCEEFGPEDLVAQAVKAEAAGFDCLWISDHFHPWNDEQGQSPFVWSVIGALSQACSLPVTTAVTCPTVRMNPAIVAQAAATCAVMLDGRFTLGVGTGEALNEHILGDAWPTVDIRLEMLEEAVALIRRLWTGEFVSHRGSHYRVDTARIYTLPDEPPPIFMSGFGPQAVDVAARIADGYITTSPDTAMLERFRDRSGGKPLRPAPRLHGPRQRRRDWRSPTACGAPAASPESWPRCCRHRATSNRLRSWSPSSRPVTRSPVARTPSST